MSSRHIILASITANKPALKTLPVVDMQLVTAYPDVLTKFIATLESIGGKVVQGVTVEQLRGELQKEKEQGYLVADLLPGAEGSFSYSAMDAGTLENIHKTIIGGTIGVAENGAVWIKESAMGNRLLPFICQHLVIVLKKNALVSTMHHAYAGINSFEEGFGVFLAGPSKTADIEQSLVIGAHGARSLEVYLVD